MQHIAECHNPLAAILRERGDKTVCINTQPLVVPFLIKTAAPAKIQIPRQCHSSHVTSLPVCAFSQHQKQDGYTSSMHTHIQKNTFLQSLTRASVVYSVAGATAPVCYVGRGARATL
jgi:hypothetical protein